MKLMPKKLLIIALLPAFLPLAAQARPVAQQVLVTDEKPATDAQTEQLRQRVAEAEASAHADGNTIDSTTARRAERRLERAGHPVD